MIEPRESASPSTEPEESSGEERLLGPAPSIEHGVDVMKAAVEARLFGSATPRRLGHLRVVRRLGRGAMGSVYLAFDERLSRHVALKLLEHAHGPDAGDPADSTDPLWREARAVAQLAHPNVVAVHELGTADGRPYMVMEYVEGRALNAWLADRPRRWPQILDAMIQAGRGLVAAHERGLVHRDVKPANILVGDDGRVRVADFGLAHESRLPPGAPEASAKPVVAGTPAYMAPEQWEGRADECSDQFGYCVTLFEALYGHRPFDGRSPSEVVGAMMAGHVVVPTDQGPPALGRLVLRGLRPEPGDRHRSLRALVDALDRVLAEHRRPSRSRRIRRAALLGVVGTGALAVALRSRPSAEPCETLAEAMDVTWSEAHRARLRDAMLATGVPEAADQTERTLDNLDGYVQRWQRWRHDVCAPEPTAPTDPYRLCLELARQEMEQLVDALARADVSTVGLAVQASLSLPEVDACAEDRRAGRSAALLDGHGGRVEAVVKALGTSRALARTGRLVEALEEAESVADEAGQLGVSWLEAEALLTVGELIWQLHVEGRGGAPAPEGRRTVAERTLQAALQAARHADRPMLAAQAAVDLVSLSSEAEDAELTRRWLERADALMEAAGEPTQLRGRMLVAQAGLLEDGEHVDQIRDLLRRALALHERDRPNDPWMGKALNSLGRLEYRQGNFERALELFMRRRDLTTATLGAAHPWNAMALGGMAEAELAMGHHERARRYFEAALELRRRSYGPTSRFVAHTLAHVGDVLLELRRTDDALARYRRVLEISEEVGEPWDEVRWAHNGIAAILLDRGRAEAALPHARAGTDGEPIPYAHHIDRIRRPVLVPVLVALGRIDEAAEVSAQDTQEAAALADPALIAWVHAQRIELMTARPER